MLRTQQQPYVLIGLLADLPNPASVPQGYLYHATDTGDCLFLHIATDTGIRSWLEWCGVTGITGVEGPALLKWAGGGALTSAGYSIADDVSTNNVTAAGFTPAYPLARARTALNFSINLRQHGTPSDTVVVKLVLNQATVPNPILTHTFLPNASPSGTIFTVAGPAVIPAGSTVDVIVSSPDGTGACLVSATLEVF